MYLCLDMQIYLTLSVFIHLFYVWKKRFADLVFSIEIFLLPIDYSISYYFQFDYHADCFILCFVYDSNKK